jgi:hypothetical protein
MPHVDLYQQGVKDGGSRAISTVVRLTASNEVHRNRITVVRPTPIDKRIGPVAGQPWMRLEVDTKAQLISVVAKLREGGVPAEAMTVVSEDKLEPPAAAGHHRIAYLGA